MINPKHELFKWGPIDGRPIYMDTFVRAFVKFPKFFDASWPDTIGYFKDDKGVFILDKENFAANGEKLFTEYNLDNKKIKQGWNKWIKTVKKIQEFENKELSSLSDKELKDLLIKFDFDI